MSQSTIRLDQPLSSVLITTLYLTFRSPTTATEEDPHKIRLITVGKLSAAPSLFSGRSLTKRTTAWAIYRCLRTGLGVGHPSRGPTTALSVLCVRE